jgi:hypothetical protein
MDVETLHLAYIGGCIGFVLILYLTTEIQKRRVIARQRRGHGNPIYRLNANAPLQSQMDVSSEVVTVPGIDAFMTLFVLVVTGVFMYLGWRIPMEYAGSAKGSALFTLKFDIETLSELGRGAQVVGAVCFGLAAVRLLRWLIPALALVLMFLFGAAAIEYIFEFPLIGIVAA